MLPLTQHRQIEAHSQFPQIGLCWLSAELRNPTAAASGAFAVQKGAVIEKQCLWKCGLELPESLTLAAERKGEEDRVQGGDKKEKIWVEKKGEKDGREYMGKREAHTLWVDTCMGSFQRESDTDHTFPCTCITYHMDLHKASHKSSWDRKSLLLQSCMLMRLSIEQIQVHGTCAVKLLSVHNAAIHLAAVIETTDKDVLLISSWTEISHEDIRCSLQDASSVHCPQGS